MKTYYIDGTCIENGEERMRLIQIEYFLTVAEHKSITKAAGELYTSQPALSKQMALLEEELGVKLMYRLPRGIAMTEAGQQFEADCRKILSELEDAKNRAAIIGRSGIESLNIGCFDGVVIDDFVPHLLAYLKEVAPDGHPHLHRNSMLANRKALEMNRIDMLIELQPRSVQDQEPAKGYCKKVIASRKGALIYSLQSPLARKEVVTLQDFEKEKMYLVDVKQTMGLTENGLDRLRENGLVVSNYEYTENFMTMLTNVKFGYGYTILSEPVADRDPQLRAFVLPPEFDVNIVAVWKSKHPFVGSLMENFSIS